MSLYTKQDFNPPIFSRRWLMMKIRPNMLLFANQHIISILESGLLFREDCAAVEQQTQLAETRHGWLTRGERVVAAVAVGTALAALPPTRLNRATAVSLAVYIAIPVTVRALHRYSSRGCVRALLQRMRDYLALVRRAQACLKECAAFRSQLDSVSTVLESLHTLLCHQQMALSVLLARASSALLGNVPWLNDDLAWDTVPDLTVHNLKQIHHAFLVVQSTLLKHIALAHSTPSVQARQLYKNHNERIYWIHTVILMHLAEEFKANHESLERMYRLLKNYGNSDTNLTRKPGTAVKDSWYFSEVHAGIARAHLELKLALTRCNELDLFLDTCALHNHDLDIKVLNKDIDNLVDNISKSLNTVQNSQLRLKKMLSKLGEKDDVKVEGEKEIEDVVFVKIEDVTPETKDEVFYCVKTDDEQTVQYSGDISTVPGKNERETTKLVLNELKRKLVRREDAMRERERQALAKSMDAKDEVPEFPRQINLDEYADKRGYVSKLPKKVTKKRLFHDYKIKQLKCIHDKKLKLKMKRKCANEIDLQKASSTTLYDTYSNTSVKNKLLTFERCSDTTIVTEWYKNEASAKQDDYDSCGLSDESADTASKNVVEAINATSQNGVEDKKLVEAFNTKARSSEIISKNIKYNNNQAVENNRHEASNSKNDSKAKKTTKSKSSLESYSDKNYRFSKRDLELSSSSETESDFEHYKEQQIALLKDIRKYRAARKKNHPDKRAVQPKDPEPADESLRPVEYSLGTGLAMASVLHLNGANVANRPSFLHEEQFIGEGDLSADSGNEEVET